MLNWWRAQRAAATLRRHANEVLAAAREDDAEEAAAAHRRVLDLARNQRPAWAAPTLRDGVPVVLTFGQARQYQIRPAELPPASATRAVILAMEAERGDTRHGDRRPAADQWQKWPPESGR
jgi:hypothetical protein